MKSKKAPNADGLTAENTAAITATPVADAEIFAHLEPELRPAASAALKEAEFMPGLSSATLSRVRAIYKTYDTAPRGDVPLFMRIIQGANGEPPVTVYVINAGKAGGRPAILHTHGGGFVLGTARSAIPALQALAKELDCVVVTVDYRLAPETTYQGSIEDNYAGLLWLHANASVLGVDRARIAVMGESAGAGHAALLAITARDRGVVPLAFQCLIYPMLDDRTGSSRQAAPFMGKLAWSASDNRFGWASFLGMKAGARDVPKKAVPARVENLAGLPPAYICVGSIDLFVNEDIEYARRLNDAGADTELVVLPGVFHGFDLYPEAANTQVVRRFSDARLNALRRGLRIG